MVDDEDEIGIALDDAQEIGPRPAVGVMTGMPALAAAGQNQSAVPSVSHRSAGG